MEPRLMMEAGTSVFDEVFSKHLAGQKHALGVDVHDPVVFILGNVEERRGGVHARAIDENVAAAGALQHLIEQDLQVGFAAGVGRDKVGLPTGGLNGFEPLVGLRLIATDEHDFRASGGIAFGDGAAEFAGAADDDSGFALKRKEFENGGHGEWRIYGVSFPRCKPLSPVTFVILTPRRAVLSGASCLGATFSRFSPAFSSARRRL
jgi:hypothetical protein